MILTDNETKVDLLNSDSIAETIVKLIRDRPEHPITVGVHGDWGAGKSSVLEMIELKLQQEENVLCIKFNGWRFQGFEDAKIALIEAIVTDLIDKKSLFEKAKEEVADILDRINWLKAAKKAGGFLLTAATGIPNGEVVDSILTGLQSLASNPSQLATKENLEAIATQTSGLLKPKDLNKNIPKEIGEFRKAFDKLLDKANVTQLIVLVDDLDRCLPDTAIETLEAIRLFIFTNKTAFVIAADEGMIEYAVRKHFPDLPETPMHQAYTRNYLEKLIQVPFKIPILGETETKIYVTLLLVGSEVGECAEFDALINVAKELLKKPWESRPLSAEIVHSTLGIQAKKVRHALDISNQVGPILASGTNGNPRQIKRFLNTLLLRYRTAEARGFSDEIQLPVLTKLMIAERYIPRLFDQIATGSANSTDGFCDELEVLEDALKSLEVPIEENNPETQTTGLQTQQKKEKIKTSAPVIQRKEPNAIAAEWLATDSIKDWAKLLPALKGVDLRPYIFIAKEKKDYFGTSTLLGHLTWLTDKLFGARFVVQSLSPQINALSKADASRVFEEIRARLTSINNYTKEPEGIQGLTAVVKVHTELQDRLIDFLETLPTDTLGVWVLKGWEGILQDDAKAKFERLVTQWASNSNPMLKIAASAVKKLPARNK